MPDIQEPKEVIRWCYVLSIPQITARLELQHMLDEFIDPFRA